MAILSDADAAEAREWLKDMVHPVRLIHFTQDLNLPYGRQAKQLLTDLVSLSEKLSLEIRNFLLEGDQVVHYQIDKVPATVIRNGKDYGIRFYGLPAGYEFSSLLDAVIMVSRQDSRLTPKSREMLRQVKRPLHLEVFVTPTCPHCPRAVRLAQQFAMENDLIRADAIEATEFPEEASRYRVFSVPKTIINGGASFEGSLPEEFFLERVLANLPEFADGGAEA